MSKPAEKPVFAKKRLKVAPRVADKPIEAMNRLVETMQNMAKPAKSSNANGS